MLLVPRWFLLSPLPRPTVLATPTSCQSAPSRPRVPHVPPACLQHLHLRRDLKDARVLGVALGAQATPRLTKQGLQGLQGFCHEKIEGTTYSLRNQKKGVLFLGL